MDKADFTLDTKNFDSAASKCEDLAKLLSETKREVDKYTVNLLDSWQGEGSKAFQKKYHILSQRLLDLSDTMHDMANTIYESEGSYIQADVNLAKSIDGVKKYD